MGCVSCWSLEQTRCSEEYTGCQARTAYEDHRPEETTRPSVLVPLRLLWYQRSPCRGALSVASVTYCGRRETGDGMCRPGDWCTHANHTRFRTIWGKNRDRVIDRIHSQFAILGNTFEPAAPGQFGSVLRYFRESMQQLPYVSAGAPSRNDAEIVSVALLLLLLLLLFQWSGVRNTCQKIVPETEPEVRFRRVSSRPNQTKPVQ